MELKREVAPSKRLCICVPTYNRAGHLAELISCFARELEGREDEVAVLVADNASTDATPEVLAGASEAHTWLRTHRQDENLGPRGNMEWMIDRVQDAEYLWVFGDDDLIVPGGLATVLDLLAAEEPTWLFLPHAWYDASGELTGASPVPSATQRYANSGELYRAWYHFLTFASASVVRAPELKAAVQSFEGDSAYHPLLWYFRAAIDGTCVVADRCLVHGSPYISWEDRKHEILTLHFTSLYDDGLCAGITAAEFGGTLDHLYNTGFGLDLWQRVPLERLVDAVSRFPQSRGLRSYLWHIAREQQRRDLVDVVDQAARSVGADARAAELVELGEGAFAAGDLTAASHHFTEAVAEMPTSTSAWNDLGVVAFQLGQPDTRELLENALFIAPDDIGALVNRASILLQAGHLADARADAARANELDPTNQEAIALLAASAGSPA